MATGRAPFSPVSRLLLSIAGFLASQSSPQKLEETQLTGTFGVKGSNLMLSQPFVLIAFQTGERPNVHLSTNHQPDVLGHVRRYVGKVGALGWRTGQHQALRPEILDVVCHCVKAVSKAQCSDVCVGLS